MKTTFNRSNYLKGNTPNRLRIVTDVILAAGAAAAGILGLPLLFPVIVLSPLLVNICTPVLILSLLIKFFSKFWGKDYSQ